MQATDDDDALVSLADVADMGDVTRPAVSNWRRRHFDFPKPVEETGTTSLFRLGDIRAWMTKHNKRFDARSVDQVVWSALNPERGLVLPEAVVQEGMALLAYLTLSRRLGHDRLSELRAAIVDDDPSALDILLAELNEQMRSHHLGEIFAAWKTVTHSSAARPFLAKLLDLAMRHGVGDAFDALIAAVGRGARGEGDHTTPAALTELIMTLAGPGSGVVVDPACGYGTLLVAASRAASGRLTLIGQDVNSDACDIARLRMFVHGLSANISQGNTLETRGSSADPALIDTAEADLVLADPLPAVSWGLKLINEGRMPYGIPPASNPEMAWLQVAISMLKPGGTAMLVLGSGATFRSGPEGEIRRRIIEARCVWAIVALPPALYPTSSIPVSLWILTKPSRFVTPLPDDRLLLVDASRLGKRRGKTRTELEAADVDAIVACVQDWEAIGQVTAEGGVRAAAVPVDTLLAAGGNVTPARWVEDSDADPAQLLRRITVAESGLRMAGAELHNSTFTIPALEIEHDGPSTDSWTTRKLTDLAVIIRPRRVDPELIGTGATPLILARDIGADLAITPSGHVDAELSADRIDFTQPGDIVVTDGAKPCAAVDPVGGAAVSAPLQIIRPRPGMLLPVVLAALIRSIAPRYVAGTAITHVDLAAVEVPFPDPWTARRLGQALEELGEQRRQATAVIEAIDELKDGLVDVLSSSAIRVGKPSAFENQQLRARGAEP